MLQAKITLTKTKAPTSIQPTCLKNKETNKQKKISAVLSLLLTSDILHKCLLIHNVLEQVKLLWVSYIASHPLPTLRH